MDIRFIDSRYKELFRIPDGGCVKISLNNGGTLIGKCKYIDDYHFTLTKNEGCTKKTMDSLKKAIGIMPKHKDMER